MTGIGVGRRAFVQGAAAFASARVLRVETAFAQASIPNTTGTNPPKLKAPANAADCHMHIYDPARFAMPPNLRVAPMNATVEDYRKLRARNGTTRTVVVTPRNYGIQNDVTVDAIARLGNARGVAVLHPDVTDAELKRLGYAGIRGTRFSLGDPRTAAVTVDMVEPLSKRVADLGWHVQFNVEGDMIVEMEPILDRLPSAMVFDHLGHPPLPAGTNHPSHAIIRRLIDKGRTWVKLSGAYSNTRQGPPYADATLIAQDFVKAAPERLVWGSDWPHPTEANDHKPDDALLFDLLSEWAPDESVRRRILVENPETLYGFPKTA